MNHFRTPREYSSYMAGYIDIKKKKRTERYWRSRNRERCIYYGMKQRCYNPNSAFYYRYGGRGITICDRWLESIENFLNDVGKAPSHRHSIDRINNDGDYEPGNVRWALQLEQGNNTSVNRHITADGETHTLSEWSRIRSIDFRLISTRINRGWTADEALGFVGRNHVPKPRFDPPVTKQCINCERTFVGMSQSRYCSPNCRSNYHYHHVIRLRKAHNA